MSGERTTSQLAPCPYCGCADATQHSEPNPTVSWIECCECGARGPMYARRDYRDEHYKHAARAAWNGVATNYGRGRASGYDDASREAGWLADREEGEKRVALHAAAEHLRLVTEKLARVIDEDGP